MKRRNNIMFFVLAGLILTSMAESKQLTASYYTVESCLREGTSGIMANGKALKDDDYTAASWDYSFKSRVKVTNVNNGKSVTVSITDRGPSRRLYRQGRVIDLSRAAFEKIASLKEGIIPVKIEEIK